LHRHHPNPQQISPYQQQEGGESEIESARPHLIGKKIYILKNAETKNMKNIPFDASHIII